MAKPSDKPSADVSYNSKRKRRVPLAKLKEDEVGEVQEVGYCSNVVVGACCCFRFTFIILLLFFF
jgi:hypothetical protein